VLLPEKARVVLMGDRFYGAAALIGWCRDQGWGFRLRCRKDLLVFDEDSVRTTLATCFARGERMLTAIALTEKRARTNIAMVQEAAIPSHGSSLCPIHRRPGGRMMTACAGASRRCSTISRRAASIWKTPRSSAPTRLVLTLGLALYWAVSTGMGDGVENKTPAEKKPGTPNAAASPAA
jgi:hypothetical protein